jgi:hypothetical protein
MSRTTSTIRIPRLPAAARKAGATSIERCDPWTFVVGFVLEGTDYSLPGKGPAVVAALRAAGWEVEWKGEQRFGIIVRF